MSIFQITQELIFPNPLLAEETGLLAVGGDLSPQRLILAYSNGIFPWFDDEQPILWWAPDPRMILVPSEFHCSRTLKKTITKGIFQVTKDDHFEQVITACSSIEREGQTGTWITKEMIEAYLVLHECGYAHSYEVWHEQQLVGGLYGVQIGSLFFGESMFSRMANASKVAFFHMVKDYAQAPFIDCQLPTKHLQSLGARTIPLKEYLKQLYQHLESIAI